MNSRLVNAGTKRCMSITLAIVVSCMLVSLVASSNADPLDVFADGCATDDDHDPNVDAMFAPLIDADPPLEGRWKRGFANEERRYPGGVFRISDDESSIHLVSILSADEDDRIPPLLWHVISVPAVAGRRGVRPAAFIARHSEIRRRDPDWWNEAGLNVVPSSDRFGGLLTYVDMSLAESRIEDITNAWQHAFPLVTESLVSPSWDNEVHYSHTFIYVDAPPDYRSIGVEGDRRNSSKRVSVPGQAFGFVLDEAGRCLAAARLTLTVDDGARPDDTDG